VDVCVVYEYNVCVLDCVCVYVCVYVEKECVTENACICVRESECICVFNVHTSAYLPSPPPKTVLYYF